MKTTTQPKIKITNAMLIDTQIKALYNMIDGKCCHQDFINEVMTAINSLKEIRKSC